METLIALALTWYYQVFPESEIDSEFVAMAFVHPDGRVGPDGEVYNASEHGHFRQVGGVVDAQSLYGADSSFGRLTNYTEMSQAGHTYVIGDEYVGFEPDEHTMLTGLGGELRGVRHEPGIELSEEASEARELAAEHLGFETPDTDRTWNELDEDGYRVRVTAQRLATDRRVEDGDLMTDTRCVDWETVVIDGRPVQRVTQTPGAVAFHAPPSQRQGTGPERWDWEREIRDAEIADVEFRSSLPLEMLGKRAGVWREMFYLAMWRAARRDALVAEAKRCYAAIRKARKAGDDKLANRWRQRVEKLATGTRDRYTGAAFPTGKGNPIKGLGVKQVVKRGQQEWSYLYLTKVQLIEVLAACVVALGYKDAPDSWLPASWRRCTACGGTGAHARSGLCWPCYSSQRAERA